MNIFKHNGRWGIEDIDDEGRGGIVYEADFTKKAAERIIQLETSDNPPADWEETREILEREGFRENDFEKITHN